MTESIGTLKTSHLSSGVRVVASGALWVLSVVSSSAVGATAIPDAYVQAASQHDVPPDILYAVALTESKKQLEHGVRPWPWTLNVKGEGRYFSSRKDACDALYRAMFETQLIDIGVAQINMRWQPQLFGAGNRFVDPCDALDPHANLEEAAGLLRQHYDGSGDWLTAAGRYHRPAGGEPAARYRRAVAANLERLPTRNAMSIEPDVQDVLDVVMDVQVATGMGTGTGEAVRDDSLVWRDMDDRLDVDDRLEWVSPSLPGTWVEPGADWFRQVAAIE